ncbi:MAG: protein translocase subunit SecD, partial [Phenylobacterium sp.]
MMNLARWKVIVVVLATMFGLLFTLPNLLPAKVRDGLPGFMPKNTLHLGLDLQGGSRLLYSVDTVALRTERLTNMAEDIRTSFREKNIAFTDLAVTNGEIGLRITDASQLDT